MVMGKNDVDEPDKKKKKRHHFAGNRRRKKQHYTNNWKESETYRAATVRHDTI